MKKLTAFALLISAITLSPLAVASNSTVSLGYAHSDIKNVAGINGINMKYRYEWDSPLSIISSLTYMSGSKDFFDSTNAYNYRTTENFKYYSLSAGPAYRINQYVSLYGLVGINYNKADIDFVQSGKGSNTSILYQENYNMKKTSVMYGFGVQVNPSQNLMLDLGYEGSRIKDDYKSYRINGFNIGVGYRF